MDKKEDSIIEKITKVRLRWYVVIGIIFGFGIGGVNVFLTYSDTTSPNPDFSWTEYQNVKYKMCPEDYLWYDGHVNGCVSNGLVGQISASEGYVNQYPTVMNDDGTNDFQAPD